jgi:S1-C subfamily serine protease
MVVSIWFALSFVGTGFFIDTHSVLTNWHVCEPMIVNQAPATVEGAPATVVRYDAAVDLCLLDAKAAAPYMPPVAQHVAVGEAVFTRGYPRGEYKESAGRFRGVEVMRVRQRPFNGTCPPGEFRIYIHWCARTYHVGVTTLYAAGGSSGSPVFNIDGAVVGVVQVEMAHKRAGMVPLDNVRRFLNL